MNFKSIAAIHRFKCIKPIQSIMFYKRSLSDLPDALKSSRVFPQDLPQSSQLDTIQPVIELGANTPVGWIENGLDFLHTSGDLSWGLSIIVGTLIMRGLLMPIAVKGQLEAAKLQAIKPALTPIQEKLQKAKKIGDKVAAQVETQKMIKLFKENNINPLKGFLGLIQIPFFISFFIAVSKMGHASIPGFEDGGYGWITNLSAPDPTYIVPLSLPVITYWSMFVSDKANPGAVPPIMKNVMLVFMTLGLYFTVSLPAAVFYYLIPSIIISTLQTVLFNNPQFRKAVGLPLLEKQSPPAHDESNIKSVAAIRPMNLSEAFREAKEAIGKKSAGSSRCGSLNLGNSTISTPNILTFTSVGSIPHVSPSLFSDIAPFNKNLPLLVALQDFIFLTSETLFPKKDHRITKKPKIESLQKFIGLKEYLRLSQDTIVIGELRDIYDCLKVHQNLEVTDDFAKVYTCRGGVGTITAQSYAKAVIQLKPDVVVSMADANDPQNQGNVKKRLTRSLARTIKFLDVLVESVKESGMYIPVFATCVGGDDLDIRRSCSQIIGERKDVDGYVIPLSQCSNLDFKDRLASSLELLPFDKPKIVYGLSNFSQILYAISQGIDLVDGLIPYLYTFQGIGLDLKFNGTDRRCNCLDLNDTVFQDDISPIDSSCSCYACKNHSRAYIHHLLKCKEMLAGVLLTTHNISASDRFMSDIRVSIKAGSFMKDSAEFDSISQEGALSQ